MPKSLTRRDKLDCLGVLDLAWDFSPARKCRPGAGLEEEWEDPVLNVNHLDLNVDYGVGLHQVRTLFFIKQVSHYPAYIRIGKKTIDLPGGPVNDPCHEYSHGVSIPPHLCRTPWVPLIRRQDLEAGKLVSCRPCTYQPTPCPNPSVQSYRSLCGWGPRFQHRPHQTQCLEAKNLVFHQTFVINTI